MSKKTKKLIATILFIVSAIGIFGLLSATDFVHTWQDKLSSNLYYEQEPSQDIVIVYIDDYSLDVLGRWQDWTREYYATAIDNLTGVKAVGLDLVFDQKSKGISTENFNSAINSNEYVDEVLTDLLEYFGENHPDDMALATAMESSGNVFLVAYPPDTTSIDIIAEASAGEGFSYSNVSQSGLVLQINTEGSFDKKIAEFVSGETMELPDEMYVNYVGPAGSYEYYSFADIYAGNFEDLKDKIVLIGVGTPVLQDHYSVPLGETNMYGVEIHANAIQTILEGNFLLDATFGQKILVLAVMSAIAVGFFMYLNIWGGLVAFLALAVTYLLGAKMAFHSGLILDLIYPYLAILALYVTCMLYRYFTEIQEKKEIKSAFGHYVSQDVVEQIMKNPDSLKLGGEQREITAFFADIASFTTWSEGAEPEALVAQLNEYFSMLSNIIMRNQGTVDKFEGDAIMAFWGAPLPVANHAELACKTALECRSALEDLNKKWTTEDKNKINIRIGINTGTAIIGNIGSAERFDYTAIGDSVNLAARLESANKFYKTQIMISGNSLTENFETRRLDRVRVKGKTEPIDIFELLSVKGGLAEGADVLINDFHSAIEYYRNGKFIEARDRLQALLEKAPNDGPIQTYLERIKGLIANPPGNWDGTWGFDAK